ncbi:hypothetical protein D9611_009664 [Ephemerocybe angulata]|uniref:Fungal-type protein kinase domain-containing protein n=1 Tax=Ephemerocybe angulata TaxID=980116 RepID=A0A8H5C620_9AGAR|nr:hypothetical protein D9611_009664 [Tulosesus angulatus]
MNIDHYKTFEVTPAFNGGERELDRSPQSYCSGIKNLALSPHSPVEKQVSKHEALTFPPRADSPTTTTPPPVCKVLMPPILGTFASHLSPSAFNAPFWDLIRCHYHLWHLGMRHLDVCLGNMAFVMIDGPPESHSPVPRGTFIDFDLPPRAEVKGSSGKIAPRADTMPFMAMNLLNGDAEQPRYRHGLESFLWSALMYSTHDREQYRWHGWNAGPEATYRSKAKWLGAYYRWNLMDLDEDSPPKIGPMPFSQYWPSDDFPIGRPSAGLWCSALRCLATWTGMKKPEYHEEQEDGYYIQLVENEFPCRHV